jgi:hypothetical protein
VVQTGLWSQQKYFIAVYEEILSDALEIKGNRFAFNFIPIFVENYFTSRNIIYTHKRFSDEFQGAHQDP